MNDAEARDPELDPESRRIARLLDDLAALEADEMREAEALADAPGSRRVETTLAAAWGEPARGRPGRALWLLALAAAGILAVFLVRDDGGGAGPRGAYLGDAPFAIRYPPEHTSAWDRVEWTGPADATYRLRIRDAATGRDLQAPVEIERATRLALDPEATSAWPAKITLELERRGADGTWTAAAPVESELRP